MRFTLRGLAVILTSSALLVGCKTYTSLTTPSDQTDACHSQAVQQLIGKRASPAVLDQARRDSGAVEARILRPDDITTLEYLERRLTLTADEAMVIQRVSCG